MSVDDRELLRTLLILLACTGFFLLAFLTVLVILLLAGARRARVVFDHWMTPDPVQLTARLDALRRRHPRSDNDELVARVINDQAFRAGLVGAVTGIGGVLTLPIAVPIDFAMTAKVQAATVHFIAQTYAPGQSRDAMRLQTYAILAGQGFSRHWLEASSHTVQRAITRFIGRLMLGTAAEALLKVVPFFGALVGFVFNYASTRWVGRLAIRWYREDAGRMTKDE